MATSRTEIVEKLKEIFKRAVKNNAGEQLVYDENANLVTDLGLSSVGVLYVVIAIEETFNVEFENVGFSDFETVKSVVDFIEKQVNL